VNNWFMHINGAWYVINTLRDGLRYIRTSISA